MLFKIIGSIIIPISFPIIWATDQFVSLFQPFHDLCNAICFYTTVNFFDDSSPSSDYCKNTSNLSMLIFSLVVYSLRIIQCLRIGLCYGEYWKKS